MTGLTQKERLIFLEESCISFINGERSLFSFIVQCAKADVFFKTRIKVTIPVVDSAPVADTSLFKFKKQN